MAVDKSIDYEMQGKKKPARNYLGKQKTVSNVPVKWQSGPDTPPTELAYITEAEKDLLLKADLHGSLADGPNTGPEGIMSLDSQGDYTRDRSPGAYGGGSRQSRDRNEQNMREILTGQKNIGQTTKTGPKTRKYAVPEYVKVRQPDGTYKNKYIGSGYKSYGQPSFLGNLFSRGAPGYRGIKGMPAFFGKPGFETRGVPGQEGFGYYSDIKNFGDTRDPVPLGIIGLLANLAEKFRKPKDMSEFNELGLLTDRVNPTFQNDLGNELMLSIQKTPERFLPNAGPKQVNIPTESYGLQNYSVAPYPFGYGVAPYPSYGYAGAAVPEGTDALAPTPVEKVRDNFYKGIQENFGKPISNFLNTGMDADTVAALENKAIRDYGLDSATGPVSDFRHMAALNELSKTLSPMDNRVGEFIGDTLAYGAGLINEVPALFRGLNKENLAEIREDLAANYAGTYGTPQTMQPIDVYNQVFADALPTSIASQTAPYGTAAADEINITGGMLNSPFMESQIGPRIMAAENEFLNQGKMPPEFLGDRIRMNMELGNARGFMGPGFAEGGIASLSNGRG